MMMSKHILSILAVFALAGCALFSGDKQGAAVQKILSLESTPPAISDLSSGREAMESVVRSQKRGKDPVFIPLQANDLEAAALDSWASKKGFALRVDSHDFAGAKPSDMAGWLKDNKPGYDYVSETSIRKWGVRKHPKDSTRRVVYVSLMHTITGAQTGKVYASHSCAKDTLASIPLDKAPSVHTLLKNDRAQLKSLMAGLIRQCADDIAKKGA